MGARTVVLSLFCALLARPERVSLPGAPLIVDDPETLMRLEENGYAFETVLSATQRDALQKTLTEDMAELTMGAEPDNPRRPFQPRWLTVGRFELTGVVNRFDRRAFATSPEGDFSCGEVRLVYRLALAPRGRPVTRLPMTVNVRIPQPKPAGGDCRSVAQRWLTQRDITEILRELPPLSNVETNVQSIHVPATRKDMDDNSEYVLRSFKAQGDTLVADTLFNTPRVDLSEVERALLLDWIVTNVAAIDAGTAVVPERFLASRSISVSPRGLVHLQNKPFWQLFGLSRDALAKLPLDRMQRARTPELLVRRLDEGTCAGCHQSRGIAGFHLLGEERDATQSFNALAVGHSPHLHADLTWRAQYLAGTESARPFAGHPDGPGRYGAECGIAEGFREWTCAPGLVCRDIHHAEVGVCAPPEGGAPGDPCEDVRLRPSSRPEKDIVSRLPPDDACPAARGNQATGAFCAPNWLGFTGGMCSERCSVQGEITNGGICAPLPAAGYEGDCFLSDEPIEACLERHFVTARIATCDAATPCRDDYACTRVPGAKPGTGACVPPYFVFQARVDGPRLDR